MTCVCLFAGNLKLVPYGPQYDRQTIDWLNDPDLRATFGLNRPITLESHRLWIANSPHVLVWAILDGRLLHRGNVLLHCSWTNRSAYFQIYIGDSSFRGGGAGSRVLRAALWHAFDDLGLHRVWLHTLPGNTRAECMYKHAGFSVEGCEREAILRDGSFCSQLRWSLLDHEWRSKTDAHKA